MDPARASIIEFSFDLCASGDCVTLTHRDFSRQGTRHAKATCDKMTGMDRWAEWLQGYAARPGAAQTPKM